MTKEIWIARDGNGSLWAFNTKPVKWGNNVVPKRGDGYPINSMDMLFKDLKFKDEPLRFLLKADKNDKGRSI